MTTNYHGSNSIFPLPLSKTSKKYTGYEKLVGGDPNLLAKLTLGEVVNKVVKKPKIKMIICTPNYCD
jgi:hypothetical protein